MMNMMREVVMASRSLKPSAEVSGHLALKLYPGYLLWPGKSWTEDLPPDLFPDMQEDERDRWHGLSTFQDRGI